METISWAQITSLGVGIARAGFGQGLAFINGVHLAYFNLEAGIGLGHILALHYRSPTSYQIR
jgi:hypothetical protein